MTTCLNAIGLLSRVLEFINKQQPNIRNGSGSNSPALKIPGQCKGYHTQKENKKVVGHLNKDLHSLIENNEHSEKAAPYILGKDFDS